MYQFVVYEDDRSVQERIKDSIIEAAKEIICNYKIYCYACYNNSLEEVINERNSKIYVLDVEIQGGNGFEIARKIRIRDRKSSIILMTEKDDLYGRVVRERLQPLDYIVKSNQKCFERLEETIKIAIYDMGSSSKKILFLEEKHILYPIDFNEITYVHREVKERKLIVHTNKRQYKISKSLISLVNQLDSRFFQCHRSCIVNIEHIESINLNEESITLKNGEKIFLLSRDRKKELNDCIFPIEQRKSNRE